MGLVSIPKPELQRHLSDDSFGDHSSGSGAADTHMRATTPTADGPTSLLDRFMGSSDMLSPGKAKKSSSMQRKLVDMLSPLLVGARSSSASSPKPASSSHPPTPSTPHPSDSPPYGPTAMQTSPYASPGSTTPLAPHSPIGRSHAADSMSRIDLASRSSAKKTSADSAGSTGTNMATSPRPAPAPARVPAAAAAPSPHAQVMATFGLSPAAAPASVTTSTSGPSLVTPQLDRLLHAARHCRLPPSPRAEPPPGAPAGTPNMTTLLALSHTLPPRMQRPQWCLEDYTIGEKLYTGYASTVYKAVCNRSGEVVVLKIYTLAAVCDLYKYQIYREVRVHAGLQHENIVHLFAAFQEGDSVIMVQEYADGSDLFTLLHKYGGRLSERLAVQVVLDPFLRVLHYLHTRAIIHRDIKPENILFTKNMTLKLGDFGLAIDLREERAVTRAGTLDYMAPEVLRCPFKSRPEENKDDERLHYGARVDAWAVGVLTYELLVGFPPFFDKSRTGTEERIVAKTPDYPAQLSEEAKAYISRALHKSPIERPTIHEMLTHSWVDQYRARRSMRTVPSASVTSYAAPSGSAAAPTASTAAVPAAPKARAIATSTNLITAQGQVQAAMAAAPPVHHHPAQPYPAHMHSILSSITEDKSSAPVLLKPAAAVTKMSSTYTASLSAARLHGPPSSASSMGRAGSEEDALVYMNVGVPGTDGWSASPNSKAPQAQVMGRFMAAAPPAMPHLPSH